MSHNIYYTKRPFEISLKIILCAYLFVTLLLITHFDMESHILNKQETIEGIKRISKTKPAYEVFVKNAESFFSSVDEPASSKTLWQGRYSENSLSFGDTIKDDKYQARDILKRVFNIDSQTFDVKYEMAVSGAGKEWRRMTTMTSSSLIALLCFYDVDNKALPLKVCTHKGDVIITGSKFEVQNQVSGSHCSNMDVVLTGHYESRPERRVSILLESKFSEYLTNGKCSGISLDVYSKMYNRLSDTLSKMGLTTEPDDALNENGEKAFSLTSKKGKCNHYATGIKQMISHYLGVKDYFKKEPDGDVYLAEILFDFGTAQEKKLSDYEGLYKKLALGINSLKDYDGFQMLETSLTYQNLLKGYDLDERVKLFYNL